MWARSARRSAAAVGLTLAVVALLVGVAVLAGGGPARSAAAQTGSAGATPPAGSVVVVLRTLGQVNAVLPSGEVQVLARELADPAAVVVLDDRTVLVAEAGADRISGFGGRLGPIPEPIVALAGPTGLALGSGGTVFATTATEVGRVDVATRQYETLAAGFVSATGPAVRSGVVYVPDFATGEVARVDVASGSNLGPVATGLRSPVGVATAAGLPLFISEAQGNAVVRVDASGGAPSEFAAVQGPLQLAIDPPAPGSGAWTLVVATIEGIVRLDSDGRVEDRTSLPLTVGVAAVPTPEQVAGSTGESRGSPVTTVLKDEEDGGSASPLLVIGGLVVIGAVVAVVATVLLARRARKREQELDGVLAPPEPPAGFAPGGLGAVSTGCTEEEMEVDRLQNELRLVSARLADEKARARESTESASLARDRAMRALEVRASVQTARRRGYYTGDGEPLTWAQLSFATDAGRTAFEAFRRRELTPAQLKERFTELGEHIALTQITEEGRRQMRRDPNIPWPEERQAVRDAIAARDELRAHERDAETARADALQLGQRERELTEELAAARVRLDDCRSSKHG